MLLPLSLKRFRENCTSSGILVWISTSNKYFSVMFNFSSHGTQRMFLFSIKVWKTFLYSLAQGLVSSHITLTSTKMQHNTFKYIYILHSSKSIIIIPQLGYCFLNIKHRITYLSYQGLSPSYDWTVWYHM